MKLKWFFVAIYMHRITSVNLTLFAPDSGIEPHVNDGTIMACGIVSVQYTRVPQTGLVLKQQSKQHPCVKLVNFHIDFGPILDLSLIHI